MKRDKNAISVKVPVILFKEDDVSIAYSPAVNIYGYGQSESEAKKSFETAVEEFFRYTIHKKTLRSELEALGWKVKQHMDKCTPPEFSTLLNKNAEFKRIFNKQAFKKIDRGISVPLSV